MRWYEWEPGHSRRPGGAGSARPFGVATIRLAGEDAISRAAEVLSGGGVLVHPTSTVYGLGGRPSPPIDARISVIKVRQQIPLILLAASRDALREALPGVAWPASAERLAAAFWPGPLSLVLDDGTERGVAVRVDGHPVPRALLERAGGLMTSSSLNVTGRRPARTRREVRSALSSLDLQPGPGGWLDAGDLGTMPASTLVSVRGATPEVLREGAIPRSEVEGILA